MFKNEIRPNYLGQNNFLNGKQPFRVIPISIGKIYLYHLKKARQKSGDRFIGCREMDQFESMDSKWRTGQGWPSFWYSQLPQ